MKELQIFRTQLNLEHDLHPVLRFSNQLPDSDEKRVANLPNKLALLTVDFLVRQYGKISLHV